MCGIFGIEDQADAATFTYLGLYALQHRGQESSGIVSWDGEALRVRRGMGQIADVFDEGTLARLAGRRALGHTRYSTSGTSVLDNAQPIVANTSMGSLALVHNGNLVNAVSERRRLESGGSIFQTSSDTEVILHLMARNPRRDLVESLLVALQRVRGAYSLILLTPGGLIAARDPHGFRPLVLGALADGGVCFASESCAFDLLGARLVREIEPGEVVVARGGELESYRMSQLREPARCLFELVYFARPDSTVFGESVSQARLAMGAQLAREAPADADVVVPVPDSGLFSALGYARESGLPLEFGLIRNHYVGRTFIEPKQAIRHFGVKVKLNPVRQLIAGQRVVLVDDSIVRGTTSPKIVKMVRDGGAREVHVRISCPPTAWPCYYGIDMPTRQELVAANNSVEEIRGFIDADSLAYLSLEGLSQSLPSGQGGHCTACWSGSYPEPVTGADRRQAELFPQLKEVEP
ncbi:MAG: amidophosphoribosyltransferase [Acidobacteriota bacterium]|nr:amidophosphoribosyltransferase [Acidobacteriota bacterium]MDH3523055.1 amidophosphoribosyltransferase [Acidobacteriota bacterium]